MADAAFSFSPVVVAVLRNACRAICANGTSMANFGSSERSQGLLCIGLLAAGIVPLGSMSPSE